MRARETLPIILTVLSACGGSPQRPSTVPSTRFKLSGQVNEAPPFNSTKITGARVEVIDGPDAGKNATTDANGTYTLTDLSPGAFTLRATAAGYEGATVGVTLTSNATQGIALHLTGPRTKFGAGTYLVNVDVPPGRYYSSPSGFCTFYRLSGTVPTPMISLGSEVALAHSSR